MITPIRRIKKTLMETSKAAYSYLNDVHNSLKG